MSTRETPLIRVIGVGYTGERAALTMGALPRPSVSYTLPTESDRGVDTLLYLLGDLRDAPSIERDMARIAREMRPRATLILAAVASPGGSVPSTLEGSVDSLFPLSVGAGDEAVDGLLRAVEGIVDLLIAPGIIPAHVSDIQPLLADCGLGAVGVGLGVGYGAAKRAVEKALGALPHGSLDGAYGLLANITAGVDFSVDDYAAVAGRLGEALREDTLLGLNSVVREGDLVRVTLFATGRRQRMDTRDRTGVAATA